MSESSPPRALLDGALVGVELDADDERILAWLVVQDPGAVVVLANLIRRARAVERQQAEHVAVELLTSATSALEELHAERARRTGRVAHRP